MRPIMPKSGIRSTLTLLAVALALTGVGCGGNGETGTETETETPSASDSVTSVHVLTGHAVEDFDTWRERFAESQAVRQEAGITDEQILRGIENPNLVFLLANAPSEETAEAFLADPDLARSMEYSGVEGAVIHEVLAAGDSYAGGDTLTQRLLVRHPVRDYDRWKNTFDGHRQARADAGVYELLVTHPLDEPNDVYMMFGVTNVETVNDYMASDILRIAMRLAGVSGEPQAYFVERVE